MYPSSYHIIHTLPTSYLVIQFSDQSRMSLTPKNKSSERNSHSSLISNRYIQPIYKIMHLKDLQPTLNYPTKKKSIKKSNQIYKMRKPKTTQLANKDNKYIVVSKQVVKMLNDGCFTSHLNNHITQNILEYASYLLHCTIFVRLGNLHMSHRIK